MTYSELQALAMESDLDHWIADEGGYLDDLDEVIELIQTGSVTTTVAGKKYVLSITVEEAV